MGILAPKIDGNEAEKKIASVLNRPWYRKIESWLTILNIVALLFNIFITYNLSYKSSNVRKSCMAEAEFDRRSTIISDDTLRQKFIDSYYQNCLHRFGLEK